MAYMYQQYPIYNQQYQAQSLQQPSQYQAQLQQTPLQIQNNGFVSVRNEDEARNYPIAPGNSVTFKDETAPYVYTKTMGFSQLDRPIFEKYKLVKEDAAETPKTPQNDDLSNQVDISMIKDIKSEIKAIWGEIDGIKNKKESGTRKTAKAGDD